MPISLITLYALHPDYNCNNNSQVMPRWRDRMQQILVAQCIRTQFFKIPVMDIKTLKSVTHLQQLADTKSVVFYFTT